MESLSPLVRNSSARRLSLEMCQKLVSNLLSSPVRDGTKHTLLKSPIPHQRRASEAYETRYLQTDKILGKGTFGTVFSGTYKGSEVAVKILRHAGASSSGSFHLSGELNALKIPSHPHIVTIYDVIRLPTTIGLVILEQMQPGNLLSLINDPECKLTLSDAVDISRQIASALSFCHSHGILHMDVKPQNVLLASKPGVVKVSDFGTSRNLKDINESRQASKLDGTVAYTAPELFRGDKPTEKCDVYSLGITMWHILTREHPYLGETEHSIIYKVVAQSLRPQRTYSTHLSSARSVLEQNYIHLYEAAWNEDSLCRPSMHQLHWELIILRQAITKNQLSITNHR